MILWAIINFFCQLGIIMDHLAFSGNEKATPLILYS